MRMPETLGTYVKVVVFPIGITEVHIPTYHHPSTVLTGTSYRPLELGRSVRVLKYLDNLSTLTGRPGVDMLDTLGAKVRCVAGDPILYTLAVYQC